MGVKNFVTHPLLTGVITLISLGMAIYSMWDARRTSENLNSVRDGLSTRWIGTFPDNMPFIRDLLGRARHSIHILADHAMYGSYSDFENANKIVGTIRDGLAKSHDQVRVDMIFLDEKTRRGQIVRQFEHTFKDEQTTPRLADLLRRVKAKTLSLDEFAAALDSDSKRTEDTLSMMGGTIGHTQEHVPMYFWIIDGREAVFSIPDIGGEAIETSFITSDVNLTKQFVRIFEQYQQAAPGLKPDGGVQAVAP